MLQTVTHRHRQYQSFERSCHSLQLLRRNARLFSARSNSRAQPAQAPCFRSRPP